MTRAALIATGVVLCLSHCSGPARAGTVANALGVACPGHADLAPLVEAAARRHLVDRIDLVAVVAAESTCNAAAVNPRTGARGLGQILPGRSADRPGANLFDPATNLHLTAQHLAGLLVLCGSLGGAVHVYHGHRRCSGWRRDAHALRVARLVERVWREIGRIGQPRA
jgi:hypothetical protein